MTTTNTTADNTIFIVQFAALDRLNIGPFPSHDAATTWADSTFFVANGTGYEILAVVAPRPDHVTKPKPVDTTVLLATLRAAKKGMSEIQLAHETGYALTAVKAALVALKEVRATFHVYERKGKVWYADNSASGKAARLPLYRQEFPDFDYDLPVIPGMVDQSWHNDVCPHLDGNGLSLWCDYADLALRETDGGKRFALYVGDDEGILGDLIAESDDLADIMAAIAARTTTTA